MKKFLTTIFMLLSTIVVKAQDPIKDASNQLDWLQGGKLIEDWMLKVFHKEYFKYVMENFNDFIGFATVLAGIATLVYMSIKAYKLMAGEGGLQITELLKPFLLLLVISFWPAFLSLMIEPGRLLSDSLANAYDKQQQEVNDLRVKKWILQRNARMAAVDISADAAVAKYQSEKVVDEGIKTQTTGFSSFVTKPLERFWINISNGVSKWIDNLLSAISLWLVRIGVYWVFFVYIIYLGVLGTVGPLSVAFSIFPMFSSSFENWVSKFISVQFYPLLAFLVLKIGTLIQQFSLESEVTRYSEMVDIQGNVVDPAKILLFAEEGSTTGFGTTLICSILLVVAMGMVPAMASWIVQGGGVNGAGHMGRSFGLGVGRGVMTGGSIVMGKGKGLVSSVFKSGARASTGSSASARSASSGASGARGSAGSSGGASGSRGSAGSSGGASGSRGSAGSSGGAGGSRGSAGSSGGASGAGGK